MNAPNSADQFPTTCRPDSPGQRGTRKRHFARAAISLVVGLTAVAASTGIAGASTATPRPAVGPREDIVGTGLVNCGAVTGEIGFSPSSVTGGTSVEVISIWLQGSKCVAAKGTVGAKPVPKTVVLSMSFTTTNVCPPNGPIGGGTANFAYNFPPVPALMIDPSVAMNVAVTAGPPASLTGIWHLLGQVNWGSYPDPASSLFRATIRTSPIGRESCKTGVTSLYVNAGTMVNV